MWGNFAEAPKLLSSDYVLTGWGSDYKSRCRCEATAGNKKLAAAKNGSKPATCSTKDLSIY